MTRLAAAAAGIPSVQSLPVPAAMAAGFTTAETPYACEAHNPSLTDRPFGNWQSGPRLGGQNGRHCQRLPGGCNEEWSSSRFFEPDRRGAVAPARRRRPD